MPDVTVLLSVYNGEKYLQAQIESILGQCDVSVRLVVRDDGSSDRTADILKRYCEGNDTVSRIEGGNLGAASSFIQLAKACDLESEYYAFSDADDVWDQDKLITGVRALERAATPSVPLLYCSRLRIVDEELSFRGLTAVPKKPPSFANALVETITSGGTMVLNEPAFRLVQNAPIGEIVMHDAWAYLVVSAFGRILFDCSAKILYRQHAANVFGSGHGVAKRWKLRLGQLVSRKNAFYNQAREFYGLYYDRLGHEDQRVLVSYLGYRASLFHRVRYALSPSVYRQRALSSLYMRVLILFGKL